MSNLIRIFFVACFAAILVMPIARYLALASNVADLGFFMNNLWNISSDWQRAFYGHIQPLMFFWGFFYTALPSGYAPVILVLSQAVFVLIAVVVIWRAFGVFSAFAMTLYYPLWVNILFDFHFDHLVIPLLAIFFSACEKEKFGLASLSAMSLILIKEPFALQTVACGIYIWYLSFKYSNDLNRRRLLIIGGTLIALGSSAFAFMVTVLLPFFSPSVLGGFGIGSEAFSWLGKSLLEMLKNLLTNPHIIFFEIFSNPDKIVYLVVIFGLLAFIPLLYPAPLIVALPLLIIALLSRLDNYYNYANHYTAGIIVPAIVSFNKGLPRAESLFRCSVRMLGYKFANSIRGVKILFQGLLIFTLFAGHWYLSYSPISRLFWTDKIWAYSFSSYFVDPRTVAIKNAIETYIPEGGEFALSTQNTLNWSRLAHRNYYMLFPNGVAEPNFKIDWSSRSALDLWNYIFNQDTGRITVSEVRADYILLDLKRPWFVGDKGCLWVYGVCLNQDVSRQFASNVEYAIKNYDKVFEYDGFLIFRRRI